MEMNIEAAPNAGRRTKTKIREHGPAFTLLASPTTVGFASGRWIRVGSVDGWTGWLPEDEIEFEVVP